MRPKFILYKGEFYIRVGIGNKNSPRIYKSDGKLYEKDSHFELVPLKPYRDSLRARMHIESIFVHINDCEEVTDPNIVSILLILYGK